MRKLFKGGNYSRVETICGNAVFQFCTNKVNCTGSNFSSIFASFDTPAFLGGWMNSGMKGIFVKSASVPRNAADFTAPRPAAARRAAPPPTYFEWRDVWNFVWIAVKWEIWVLTRKAFTRFAYAPRRATCAPPLAGNWSPVFPYLLRRNLGKEIIFPNVSSLLMGDRPYLNGEMSKYVLADGKEIISVRKNLVFALIENLSRKNSLITKTSYLHTNILLYDQWMLILIFDSF